MMGILGGSMGSSPHGTSNGRMNPYDNSYIVRLVNYTSARYSGWDIKICSICILYVYIYYIDNYIRGIAMVT